MEPEHLREGVTIPNLNASFLVPEETRQFPKSRTPAPPPVLDMMETIIEFDEEDDGCSTSDRNHSHHFHLTSPLLNSSLQFQSPNLPTTPYSPQSPMDYSHPIPPANTPTTGNGQVAHLHSCQQQLLVVTQAAAKLAVTGCAQGVTAGPGLELLRNSLVGLSGEEQLQGTEELLRTAADFIQFCRRREGKELEGQFKREDNEGRL